MAAFNALLAWADAARTVSLKKRLGIIVAAVAVILCVMFFVVRFVPEAQATHFARAVQPNFPEVDSYPADWFTIHKDDMDELDQLSLEPSAHRPDLIIWPEAPAPFSWQDNHFSKRASSLAIRAAHPFLAGVIEWKAEKFPSGHIGQAPYNSALLVDPQGQKVFVYDKRHLVPFGEYEPFPLIHRVVQSVSDEVGGFHKGKGAAVGTLPGRIQIRVCLFVTKPSSREKFASLPPTAPTC